MGTFIGDVQRRYGAPTHLVHLPALRVVNTKFRNFDEDRFMLDFNLQVRSAIALCKAFVPAMAKAKKGRVLFMLTSYVLGLPPKNTAAYVTAKSALAGLAKSLAADYAPSGVTVNCVAPYMMAVSYTHLDVYKRQELTAPHDGGQDADLALRVDAVHIRRRVDGLGLSLIHI